ncbi:ATP-binding protein [Anaeroselena agilis]|uniref:ATP-binding protein n=1 Tax=Anaeroselena agilis TaxID=3063788 RepID=A0ABU3P4W9_9FIRM|nr:ATP-binding protein [Selenomonadales bacterium 4137-cl]
MGDIIVGKHVLESLSLGMYSNPFDIFREYIQNATDSIDNAYAQGLLSPDGGEITLTVNENSKSVSIRDNGTGISIHSAVKKLTDVGNSDKDYEENRGFRGIGRLGGLGYANALYFITSVQGEAVRTVIKWDCVRLKQLLSPSNTEKEDIIDVIEEVMSSYQEDDDTQSHYFEVRLEGISDTFSDLYNSEKIDRYLSAVAPVDFDGQRFQVSSIIKEHFTAKGHPIPTYKICHTRRHKPIYKPYTRTLSTGLQKRTHNKDYVKDVEFVYEIASDGTPLYIGWLAITDFSGQIRDEILQGIRLRKGNILVGDNTTFSRFFPSEGAVANKMFAAEIHILHPDVIPNAKRDDFEPGKVYQELATKLSTWAEHLNRTYRRGSSKIISAIRNIDKAFTELSDLERQIDTGSISSDVKRDKYISDLNKIQKSILTPKKELDVAIRKGNIDPDKKDTVTKRIKQAEESEKTLIHISNKIINADYATKRDLPTSYSKDERQIYQRIIAVIDNFFAHDLDIANKLREAIKIELSVKKK